MSKLRSWLLNLHLYSGLLCSSYLVVFALSSLAFNHPTAFPEADEEVSVWERPLVVPPIPDNGAWSEAVRDALGLMGWTLPWETRRDERGDLHFGLSRPGKHYTIHALASAGTVRVEETPKGYWNVIRSLHGMGGVPRAPLTKVWGIYTEICALTVLFSIGSGVYLWLRRRSERRVGLAVMGLVAGSSLFLMIAVTVWG